MLHHDIYPEWLQDRYRKVCLFQTRSHELAWSTIRITFLLKQSGDTRAAGIELGRLRMEGNTRLKHKGSSSPKITNKRTSHVLSAGDGYQHEEQKI